MEEDYVGFLERKLAHAEARIAKLEAENDRLSGEVSHYLAKWIAAADLAAWRQVAALAGIDPNPDKKKDNV